MSWSSSKLKKINFLKKKLFSHYNPVAFKISHICCSQSTIKNWELKDQGMWNIYFYKNNAVKNGTFRTLIMFKGGNKHARIICDTWSNLSIRAQKQRRIFSLWTTFNNSCGVQGHHWNYWKLFKVKICSHWLYFET